MCKLSTAVTVFYENNNMPLCNIPTRNNINNIGSYGGIPFILRIFFSSNQLVFAMTKWDTVEWSIFRQLQVVAYKYKSNKFLLVMKPLGSTYVLVEVLLVVVSNIGRKGCIWTGFTFSTVSVLPAWRITVFDIKIKSSWKITESSRIWSKNDN